MGNIFSCLQHPNSHFRAPKLGHLKYCLLGHQHSNIAFKRIITEMSATGTGFLLALVPWHYKLLLCQPRNQGKCRLYSKISMIKFLSLSQSFCQCLSLLTLFTLPKFNILSSGKSNRSSQMTTSFTTGPLAPLVNKLFRGILSCPQT